jgi:RIO kinase 1
VMAAKRYRGEEHRSFHRSTAYTEGRRTRRSRDARAIAKKTAHGRAVAAGQGGVGGTHAVLGRWRPGALPGPDRRHRDPHGAGPGRR